MRYVVWFVGIASLAIAYWADVVLFRLLVRRQYPFDHGAAPFLAAAPPGKTEALDLRKLRGTAGDCSLPHPDDTRRKPPRESGDNPISKTALVVGLNAVRPRINACYDTYGLPGTVMVNVVIAKEGSVSSATVTGRFAGTPTGACVERAVKTARFPESDGFATPYPFQLK